MTATPEEFVRGLRLAFADAVSQEGARWVATWRGVRMEAQITPLPARAFGPFTLPAIEVTLNFPSASDDERAAMLAWFDLVTHRGGG